MRLMGLQKAWGHDAYFAYTDRYFRWCTANGLPAWQRSYSTRAEQAWLAYRQYDLRGMNTVGPVGVGRPQLLVTRPAHVGSSWTLEVAAGAAGDRIGPLVRAGDVALRPKRDFLGFPTTGLVFLDDSLAEIAVPFVVGGSGKCTLTIPPAGDQAGDAYVLQAVLLFGNGELRPTNAVKVQVATPRQS